MPSQTRKSVSSGLSSVFGTGRELLPSELPTLRAVLRKALLLREEEANMSGKNISRIEMSKIMERVADEVSEFWRNSNSNFQPPVIIGKKAIWKRLMTAWDKGSEVSRNRVKKEVADAFYARLDKLLDITVCQCLISPCLDVGSCNKKCRGFHIACSCPQPVKLPVLELEWINDQRNKDSEKGGMQMTLVDQKEVARLNKALKRKSEEQLRIDKGRKQIAVECEDFDDSNSESSVDSLSVIDIDLNDNVCNDSDTANCEPHCQSIQTNLESQL